MLNYDRLKHTEFWWHLDESTGYLVNMPKKSKRVKFKINKQIKPLKFSPGNEDGEFQ